MAERLPLWTLCVSLCLPFACGGGGGSTAQTQAPADETRSESVEDTDDTEAESPAPPPDPCASGTCTQCGDAVCLTGFYCEEAVSACGWLPQCAESPSCECVSKVLANCSCEERDGGVYVQCG